MAREHDRTLGRSGGHGAGLAGRPRRRRGRRLALLLAVAGGIGYALMRRQQRQDLDEGVWHEAPTPTASGTTPGGASA